MESKVYNFSTIRLADLQKITNIESKINDDKFKEWFEYTYPINETEVYFLSELIRKHRRLLPFYLEEDLKMKFLSPILNQVDFMTEKFHDWYDASFSGFINGVEFKGFTDYMVATGFDVAEKPYFFIQEFKPSIPDRNPEPQLLAEMLVAVEKNNTNRLHGGYIIGRHWFFVILEKIRENTFEYFVSESFDSLKLPDLKQIYVNLQAVKLKYCVD